jgi:hypothetical protein
MDKGLIFKIIRGTTVKIHSSEFYDKFPNSFKDLIAIVSFSEHALL